MSLVNRDNLINILSNTKDKIENKINRIKVENIDTIVEEYTQNTNIPIRFYRAGGSCAVGNIIYLFGSSGGDDAYKSYKYDTTTDKYTQLAGRSFKLHDQGSCAAVGNNIYIFGGDESLNYNYMYNTTANTFTKKTNIPYNFKYGSAVAVGSIIYLIGDGYFSNASFPYANYNYKYDTTTDTYTKNTNIPYPCYYSSAINVDTNIYIFGGGYYAYTTYPYANNAYKYDTITGTYEKLEDIPYPFFWSSVGKIKNDIYLFGSYLSSYQQIAYKYDTILGTYSRLKDIPFPYFSSHIAYINNDIYLLGSGNSTYYSCNYKYTNYNGVGIFKETNHSIYTETQSFTSSKASLVTISDTDYYTEYDENNNVIKNTYPISSDGTTKMYCKINGKIDGKTLNVDSEGWKDINLLDYM